MRPPPCTDADDLLRCSATVGNLEERGEPDILTQVRHRDLLRVLRTGQSTRDLHFKHEYELHGNGEVWNRTRDLWHSRRGLTQDQFAIGAFWCSTKLAGTLTELNL